MQSRLGILVVLVGLGLGALAWFVDAERDDGEHASDARCAAFARVSEPDPIADTVEEDVLAVPRASSGRVPLSALPRGEPAGFALDGARWMSAAVRIPAGLPADDHPVLVVFVRRFSGKLGHLQEQRIASQARTAQPLEDSLPSYIAWTSHPVRDAEPLRPPAPCGAESALLVLRSRYLELPPVRVEPITDVPRVLEPRLGGWVAGRCVFPREVRRRKDVTVEVEEPTGDRRSTHCDGGGRFELWALVPDVRYTLVAHAPDLPPWKGELEVEAGRRLKRVISFELGGTARGEVVDGAGRLVSRARVSWGPASEPWSSVLTDERGRFELRGIPKGEAKLEARKLGVGSATVELSVRNGWVSPELRLELDAASTVPVVSQY